MITLTYGALFPCDRHDVGTGAQHGRFAFYFSHRCEQTLALRGIGPEAVEIARKPARSFDGDQLHQLKSSGEHISREFPGAMKERVGEIHRIGGWVTVLAFFQVTGQNRGENGIVEKTVGQRIEQRGKVADGRSPEQAAGTKHAVDLAESGETVVAVGDVIERAEEQNCFGGGIGVRKAARIADFGGSQWICRLAG